MKCFKGNPCAEGCADGAVLVKKDVHIEITETAADAEAELALLRRSMDALDKQLEEMYDRVLSESGEEAAELIESYQMILCDKHFFAQIRQWISEEKLSCAAAIRRKCDACQAEFMSMDDPYMRERFFDIEAVCKELTALCCQVPGSLTGTVLTRPTIVVADNLTPVDTVKLDKQYLRGFVMETGGATSHAVILARTLGIPAIVGISGITDEAENGMEILISGNDGTVILNPEPEQREEFQRLRLAQQALSGRYAQEPLGEVLTRDGWRIHLAVNSGDSDTAGALDSRLCDGVGLFRTEFLYMRQPSYPTEEMLFQAYRQAVTRMEGRFFVIRTLDIGGDKALDYMQLPKEENPFLGYRAVRICLDRPDLFRTQLRAILRSSVWGDVRIMFPMITCTEELHACREALVQCQEELRREGVPFREDIPVGIMVETPAALMVLEQLAQNADFFSVGTNDLVQYLMAADRGNPKLQTLYDPFQPPVLRALCHIGRTARESGIEAGICGEAGSDTAMIPFLVGCGITELSAAPSALPKMRYLIRRLDRAECEKLVENTLRIRTAAQARSYLAAFAQSVLER